MNPFMIELTRWHAAARTAITNGRVDCMNVDNRQSVPHQIMILAVQAKEPIRKAQIAERMPMLGSSTISASLTNLIAQGLMVRYGMLYALTEEGRIRFAWVR